jgi:hypothetical protein
MVWRESASSFTELLVSSVTSAGGGLYDVALTAAATVSVGDRISPDTSRRDAIAQALRDYFDGLGPGELVATTDARWDRAARFPDPAEEWPQRAGQSVIGALQTAVGGGLADGLVTSISATTPGLPTDVVLGPKKLVLGKVGIYDLP